MKDTLKEGLTYGVIGTAVWYTGNALLKIFPEAHNPEMTQYLQNVPLKEYALLTLKTGPIVGAAFAGAMLGLKGIVKSGKNFLEDILMGSAGLTRKD